MNNRITNRIVYGLLLWGMLASLSILHSCQDVALEGINNPMEVEEGIQGTLNLSLAALNSDVNEVATRNSEQESSEQHLHSAYIFIVDKNDSNPDNCHIVARKYFPDILSNLVAVKEGATILHVSQLQLPAVSCQKAQIFAITNLGYSDLQGVYNDGALLEACDKAKNLRDLMKLEALLSEKENDEIGMDRMQGHHLMSGFLGAAEDERHFLHEPPVFALKADNKGGLNIYNSNGDLMRPVGTTTQVEGKPCAVYVHRLDTKISFRILPDGALKNTPGAYFRLESWQVLNVPRACNLFWQKRKFYKGTNQSKVYKRDLNQGEDGSWNFTFYQFENAATTTDFSTLPTSGKYITAQSIADQYNKEYNLKENRVMPTDVSNSFSKYPNLYSDFAYGLRELQKKNKGENGELGEYNPNDPDNEDQVIVVKNGDYVFAPDNATYVKLVGRYYNPQEPSKRMKDDPQSMKYEKEFPIEKFPYWGKNQKPVATKEEALKRTRSATVVYYVHLGFVGGGNFSMNEEPVPDGIAEVDKSKRLNAYLKKVNDYNILRNHHYIYTLKVAGVENIKLEATREDQGNILEQEKQPGAEGSILESQHFYNLDAHFETRNLTIDFTRFPENYSKGFSFSISTPFDLLFITLKQQEGEKDKFVFVDRFGKPIESIRNHDWDWIHFAWHGSPENPYRSLIDPETGNGIPYSKTYGGYENQQTYKDGFWTQPVKDQEHPYRLLNSLEFAELVWRLYVKWIDKGKDEKNKTVTFTIYVDENYYDYNPTSNEQVSWWHFCNQPKRKALYFMEPEEISADLNSWYADAHVAIYQKAIQTLYATDNSQGQVVANVAFGIEALDEFRAKYATERHPYEGEVNSLSNGLYNTMKWFYGNKAEVLPWSDAESYFNDKCRAIVPDKQGMTENQPGGGNRDKRNPKWALYSRNRDLNRNGQLDPFEVRWFIPAIDQYTLCFLGGRPVFENPLFEKDKAVKPQSIGDGWIKGVPVAHFISSSNPSNNQIFWAEEGCSMGRFNLGHIAPLYGIRMARMLSGHGVENTGAAFENRLDETTLRQDEIFTVSQTPDGVPMEYEQRVDGKPYYILLNKMNVNAFRDRVRIGELAQHKHEQKENWLYREYRIARHKVGYTSYNSPLDYNRTVKVNGVPRTWWQVNGVWTSNWPTTSDFFYQDEEHSLAYVYSEEADGSDIHHWRMPNLRETAIMSMAFSSKWFGGAITCGTTSDNLGPNSTNLPFWHIESNRIVRLIKGASDKFYVRPIQDVP